MIKNIFRIIKDKYKIYNYKNNKENFIIIKTDFDYIKARVLIEKNKLSDDPKQLNILIQNDTFFNFFIDLEELGDITKIDNIIPLEIFSDKFKYNYPNNLSNELLYSLNIIKQLDDFNNYFDPKYRFEINLLSFELNLLTPKERYSIEDFFSKFINKEININILKNNPYLFDIFKNYYLDKLEIENIIKLDILNKIKSNDLDEYLHFLLRAYIFSNYKKYIYRNLMDKFHNPTENDLEEYYDLEFYEEKKSFFIKQYSHYENIINECNNLLQSFKKKISIFSEELDFETYIKNVSGCLNFEFDYIIYQILNNIKPNEVGNYDIAILSKIESKFFVLLKNPTINSYLTKVKILLNGLKELSNIDLSKKNFTDWAELYINDYLEWNRNLEEEKNIINIINDLSEEYNINLTNLQNHIKQKFNEINTKYEEFILENYSFLMSSEKEFGIHNQLKKIKKHINGGNSVIFIVIDAMRWDLWEIIKNIFEKYGYFSNKTKDQVSLSAIPSVTNVSRLSLFSGITYKNLHRKKINDKFAYDIMNEEKHLKNYFKNEKVRFAKGGKKDFKKLVKNKADLYTFIFTDADDMFHGIKDINHDLVESLFKNQINNIISSINKYDYLARSKIIITTDHGSVSIKDKNCKSIDKKLKDFINDKNLNYNSHGRYLKIYGDYFDKEIYNQIYNFLKENNKNYYIIRRESMGKYYLPKKEKSSINYFWLINKHEYYTQSTRGEYSHGGISMSETIIPFAIIDKSDINLQDPTVKVIDYSLQSESKSYITLSISNNNLYDMHDIRIEFEKLECAINIEFIRRNGIIEKKIYTIPTKAKKIIENINIHYEITDIKKRLNINEELVVNDSNKTKINESLKNSRDLF